MKLALVYPPFYYKLFNENLPTVDDEFGLFPYFSFGYVSHAAKAAGYEVRLFDAVGTRASYAQTLARVKEFNPDILGVALHAAQTFRDILSWIEKLKADTGLPVLGGGWVARNYPAEAMKHSCFDYLCSGEVISFFEPFAAAFERRGGFENVPDLYYREDGRVKNTFPAQKILFKDFPTPDRSIFDNSLYYSHVSQRRNFTIGVSSCGCPFPCKFCAMANTGFDARTYLQIADEMQECIERYDVHEYDWFDSVMLHDRKRMLDLSAELKARKLDMIWSTRARIDSLQKRGSPGKPDEEFIRSLSEAGCRRLFLGVESGDQEILRNMAKGLQVKNIKDILQCAADHGIMLLGFFMIGNPGETKESAEKTMRLACSLPLDYAQFCMTMMKPGSDLDTKYSVPTFGFDYWREYIGGNAHEMVLPSPWTQLAREDIQALAKKAYLRFYLRPAYMLKMLLRIESRQEFFRYVRVALQLFLRPILGHGEKRSFVVRLLRSVLIFVEALVAQLNRHGRRHDVHTFGGGLKGALRLARREFSHVHSDTKGGAK